MAKINLEEVLVGKKMEPRYLEYNWRDIALYNLAIGAKKEDNIIHMKNILKQFQLMALFLTGAQ